MKAILYVGIGGGLGSILRYLVQALARRYVSIVFPLGTFLVNIAGCFLIGIFYAMADRQAGFTTEWKLFLITGICGGFTTFSTFSYEGIMLLKQGATLHFLLYIFGSVLLGMLATVAGVALFSR